MNNATAIMINGCVLELERVLDVLKAPETHGSLDDTIDPTLLNSDELYRLTMHKLYGSCIAKLMSKQEELSPN